MNAYAIWALVWAMWFCSIVGAYTAGWCRGYSESENNRRWDRWYLRREEQRNVRL